MPNQSKPSKFPLSERYLVFDTKKCAGCIACMLACSLVHEGKSNPSFSRIQVVQSSFKPFPEDIDLIICRHCADPMCVKACPTGYFMGSSSHDRFTSMSIGPSRACLGLIP